MADLLEPTALLQAAPEVLQVLQRAVAEAEAAHTRSVRAADRHNSMDGVGIDFDYMTPTPLPGWAKAARGLLETGMADADHTDEICPCGEPDCSRPFGHSEADEEPNG